MKCIWTLVFEFVSRECVSTFRNFRYGYPWYEMLLIFFLFASPFFPYQNQGNRKHAWFLSLAACGSPPCVPARGAPTSVPARGAPTSVPVRSAPTGVPARGAPTSVPARLATKGIHEQCILFAACTALRVRVRDSIQGKHVWLIIPLAICSTTLCVPRGAAPQLRNAGPVPVWCITL